MWNRAEETRAEARRDADVFSDDSAYNEISYVEKRELRLLRVRHKEHSWKELSGFEQSR
jgi:hypothetical protein